jgi:phosphoadenosine phosphosulfate reductase
MDFVGVRSYESLERSEYEYENTSKKQKGQHSFNPLLEWTSAEVWVYIYAKGLDVNNAYKKGNARAGCVFCSMTGGKADYFLYKNYGKQIDGFIEIIKDTYLLDSDSDRSIETYVTNNGWRERKSGRDLKDNKLRCIEETENGFLTIQVIEPKTDWREWIKTLGSLNENNELYSLIYQDRLIDFLFNPIKTDIQFHFQSLWAKKFRLSVNYLDRYFVKPHIA